MIWRRSSRTAGRHRTGLPHTTVHRRLWEGPARAEAERLERSWPAWTVLYSLGRRRFYALSSWPTPQPVIVESDTAEGLEERMREIERTLTWQTPYLSATSTDKHPNLPDRHSDPDGHRGLGGYGDAASLPPPISSAFVVPLASTAGARHPLAVQRAA
ncbi:hypothetical protein [Streptosporangium carneum]|uniref:Uncharacterized protein n=1 Tax=Streptosporangium carneum TaxID=47481 RepID=A0A9W6HUM1_9ACTN|nr:hypothetical protein [Streptosporangium carneum]GLK06631.1 hypothetical protein GCM10017600_00360 [Streptosporangium carneum]